ncbi:MAG: alanine--tRNA ligase [Candidatus Paceibacterota bacterium]|nr:MAG: alanine--tRNA ligase [Candidatus Paceibacterota bacterium]
MTSGEIRRKFLNFFEKRGHKIIQSSSLIPENDPTVLFTTAGMQQFKPYYLGDSDAMKDFGSLNTATVQKCMRTSDIDEVGDETHLTFFEMLGNFSFGGYGKREAISYAHEFITKDLGLEISYVTIFEGSHGVPKDEESKEIWQSLGLTNIREEGIGDVFWGPTGSGGPCGPTTEIYCKNVTGKDVEVWNIVFNQFYYPGSREELLSGESGKELKPLAQMGVDTGMGLERLSMISQKTPTIFETDLFNGFVVTLPDNLPEDKKRVLADHARSISFLISDGVRPGNKGSGYILRRLVRRILAQFDIEIVKNSINWVTEKYKDVYRELDGVLIMEVINEEWKQFNQTLELGMKELDKLENVNPESAFKLYESFGLPFEIIHDEFPNLSREEFDKEFKKHQEVSRSGLDQKFKGGLADESEETIKLHTTHHLLLAALQKILGKEIKQRGSNITSERLRIDFSFERKLTDGEKQKIEDLVNEWISEGFEVVRKEMKKEEAEQIGAEMEFGAKYPDMVSVYFIQDKEGNTISKEFCGGPHVKNTNELGKFKIKKEEAVSAGVRRIKAVLD